ncbi:MAG: homocysteine S-methyltransferase family protein, partial [Chloroflexi bacterium]|nr:homocysteine S-methyltransferase family protein [Chloroflexota bacterium]
MSTNTRIDELKSALAQRLLVMDGAMGTAIQNKNLGPEDFGGEEYEGCNEYLLITNPDVIEDIHRAYLQAGADIIEPNTFGATPVVLAEYDLAHEARRINKDGAALAL